MEILKKNQDTFLTERYLIGFKKGLKNYHYELLKKIGKNRNWVLINFYKKKFVFES